MTRLPTSTTPRSRRLWCSLAAALLTVVVMTFLAVRGTHRAPTAQRQVDVVPTRTASAPVVPPSATPPASDEPAAPTHAALMRTDDPDTYARSVAAALFDVDVRTVSRDAFLDFWTQQAPSVVYSDAAAKGLSLEAQNQDLIDNLTTWWIPSSAVWSSEAAADTVQQLQITSVTVPDYWANAVADGTFRDPGLRMERVMGVLTQHYGTDQRHTATRALVIDLALLCGPTQPDGCRLLSPQQPPGPGQN